MHGKHNYPHSEDGRKKRHRIIEMLQRGISFARILNIARY
jgi:hypothetical protein